jgi:hypothetical protein
VQLRVRPDPEAGPGTHHQHAEHRRHEISPRTLKEGRRASSRSVASRSAMQNEPWVAGAGHRIPRIND